MSGYAVDFALLFKHSPSLLMVLEPSEIRIVGASDSYLKATMREHDDIVGKLLFDAFPAAPNEDPSNSGTELLRKSIEQVIATKRPDVMAVTRYPIERPAKDGGGFVERFWEITNSPVLNEQGDVVFVINAPQDVTQRVRAQQQAEQSELLARLAGQFAKLGWWRFQIDPPQLFWSDETAKIHDEEAGFAPSVADAVSFYKPQYRSLVESSFADCVKNGTPFDVMTEIKTAKNRELWVRSIGEPEYNQQGEIIAVHGAFQDISDLVHARDQAEQIGIQLKQTLDTISDAFFMLDHDWRFVFVNSQAERLLAITADNLIHANIWEKYPAALGTTFELEYTRAIQENTTVRFTEYYPPFDFWLQVTAYPTTDGLAVYFRDVTLELEAQKELQRSKERLELVIKATNDVIWDWDLVENSIWWSEAYTEQFGHPRTETGDDPATWLEHIHPDDHARITKSFYQVLEDPEQHNWADEYRFIRADGSIAQIADLCYVQRDNQGKPVRIIGSVLDVTERRELDERLRQSQKMEAVGQLTGGVAHDFNNLLTVILGNAELIAEQLSNNHPLKNLANMTVSAAERGSELTNRLLAFARRQPLDPKPTNIHELIKGMLPLIKRTLAESIQTELMTTDNLWLAEVDAPQLESAILNLAINARDAMPSGGRLTIESMNAHLDEDYSHAHAEVAAGDYVMISVSDTGTGMDADTLRQAFEPFFTTKSRGKGSGLGLSMVYGYVKQSNGHIKIYSELGHGTTIKIYLPRTHVELDNAFNFVHQKEIAGGRERILIVEDDDLVRQHVMTQLADFGYDIKVASSAHEALELLEAHTFDLLFSDVVMPGGMNGPQLAAEAQKKYPTMKVLFTSGYTENAIVHHGRLDPGIKLLSKPYRRQELADKIREALDQDNSE